MQGTLYFAYGSNLNRSRMFERCPDATPVRSYELIGWKLIFRRSADIVPADGHTVVGALYRITRADEVRLDRFEGVGRGRYRRKHFLIGGRWVLFYVMNSSYAKESPSAEYYAVIERGYLDWNLPTSSLVSGVKDATRHSPASQSMN